jgi:hypothetical protein
MKRFLLGVVTMTFIAYDAICCVKAEEPMTKSFVSQMERAGQV